MSRYQSPLLSPQLLRERQLPVLMEIVLVEVEAVLVELKTVRVEVETVLVEVEAMLAEVEVQLGCLARPKVPSCNVVEGLVDEACAMKLVGPIWLAQYVAKSFP